MCVLNYLFLELGSHGYVGPAVSLDPFPELGAELLFFLFDNFDYQVVICVRNSIFIYINILVFLLLCFY